MSRLDLIQNINPEPGDTLRNRKTKEDFILQSTAVIAGGAGSIYYLLRAVDGTVLQYRASDLDELNLFIVRKNVEQLLPTDVLRLRKENLEKAFRGNQSILQKIEHENSSVFKDMILLLQDTEDQNVHQKLLNLADHMLYSSKGTYTPQEIHSALIEALGQNADIYSPEHLETLAKDLHTKITSNVKASMFQRFHESAYGRYMNSSSDLGASMVDRKYGAMPKGPKFAMSGDRNFLSFMQRQFFRGDAPKDDLGIFSGMRQSNVAKATERAATSIRDAGFLAPKALINNLVFGNDFNKSMNIMGAIVDKDQSGAFADTYLKYLEMYGPDKRSLKMKNRRTAVQSRYRNRINKRYGLDDLLRNPAEITETGATRYFSIHKDTLVNEVLRGKKMVYNGNEMRGGDKMLADLLRRQGGIADGGQILVSAKQLRNISTSGEADIAELLSAHSRIASSLGPSAMTKIGAIAGSSSSAFQKNPVLEFGVKQGGSSLMTQSDNTIFRIAAGLEDTYFLGSQAAEASAFAKMHNAQVEAATLADHMADLSSVENYVSRNNVRFNPVALSTSSEANIDGAIHAVKVKANYDLIREQSRMGYAMLRDSTGNQAIRLLGTDSSTRLEDTVRRGLSAVRVGGRSNAMLDINVHTDDNGIMRISNIGMGYMEGGKLNTLMNYQGGGGVMDEVQALARLGEHLLESEHIGTQTNFHFENLRARVESLRRYGKLDGTVNLFGSQTPANEALEMLANIFEDSHLNKNYDLLTMSHVSGKFVVGNASRNKVVGTLLRQKEATAGISAVEQMFGIQGHLGLDGMKFDGILDPSKVFYNNDTRNGLTGSFLRLRGFENEGVGVSGVRAVFEHVNLLEDGTFHGTGSHIGMSAETSHLMGRQINSLRELNFTNGALSPADTAHYLEEQSKIVADKAGRIIRGISPLTGTSYNKTGLAGNVGSSAFGLQEFAVHAETQRLLGNGEALAAFDKFASANRGGSFDEITDRMVDRLMRKANLPTEQGNRAAFGASLRLNLEEALRSPTTRKMYDKDSNLSQVINSRFGQALLHNVRNSMDGDVDALHQSILMTINATGMAANMEQGAKQHFLTQPTIGLRLEPASRSYMGAVSMHLDAQTGASEVEMLAKNLAAQTLMGFHLHEDLSKPTRSIYGSLVESAGLDPQELKGIMATYMRGRDIESHIPNLNAALQTMTHADANGMPDIAHAMNNIMSSEMFRGTVRDGILGNRANYLEQHPGGEGFANQLEGMLDESFSRHANAGHAVRDFIHGAYATDKESTMAYFSTAYEARGLEHMIPAITGEMLETIDHTSLEQMAAFKGKGGSGLLSHVLEAAQQLNTSTYAAQMDYTERQRTLSSFINDSVKTVQNYEGRDVLVGLNELALQYQGRVSASNTGGVIKDTQAAFTKAMIIAENSTEATFKDALKTQHEGLLGNTIVDLSKQKGMFAALAAVGGAALLIAGTHRPEQEYNGGNASANSPGVIGAMSEIPGDPNPRAVFTGQTQPFQLKINVRGFADSRASIEALQTRLTGIASKYSSGSISRDTHVEKDQTPHLKAYDRLMRSL